MRYFTPREIANLHGFPSDFKIEAPMKIAYRLLGNSMHISVVASVLNYLFENKNII